MFYFNKWQRKQACPESAGSGYTPENSLIVLDSSRTLNSPETVQEKKNNWFYSNDLAQCSSIVRFTHSPIIS